MAVRARSRRADILAAAEQEFAVAGFAGARIERIAASADVNKQLLFHYFGSKEGLFAAALEALLARVDPASGDGKSPALELRTALVSLQRATGEQPGIVAILAEASVNQAFPREALPVAAAWLARIGARLAAIVVDGQRRGYFRDDVDPAAVAQLALAAVLGTAAVGHTESLPAVADLILDHCAWR